MSRAHALALDAFVPGADLPSREELRAPDTLGASGNALVEALIAHDHAAIARLLRGDRSLANARCGRRTMIEIAVALADPPAMALLLTHGADPDGAPPHQGAPLVLALHAADPRFAWALLAAGASPTPPDAPLAAFDAAIALGSESGVAMLLDAGAYPNVAGELARCPLHIALDTERFAIAELLVERGADPWAADAGGATLGGALAAATLDAGGETGARLRLTALVRAIGWPDPVPTPGEVRALAAAGSWPPATVAR